MVNYIVLVLLVILSMAAGCVFDINDDYDRTFANDNSQGEGGKYVVSGVIVDITGKGVSGISVELTGSNAGIATTDANGAYQFNNVPSGSYVVTPPISKYASMPITVADGDVFVGTVRSGGHGGNKNGDYSCSQCH